MATPEQRVTERVEGAAQPPASSEPAPKFTFEAKNVSIWYGQKRAIEDVSLNIISKAVTAIIGPSGCGKSTFLRALNRMHELTPKTRAWKARSCCTAKISIPKPLIPRLFAAGSAWCSKNQIRFRP